MGRGADWIRTAVAAELIFYSVSSAAYAKLRRPDSLPSPT
jgi:hypothetical protein